MEIERRFSRRCLMLVLIFMAALLLGIVAVFYWLLQTMPGSLVMATPAGEDPAMLLSRIEAFLERIRQMEIFFIPVGAGLFCLAALGLWSSLCLTLKGLLRKQNRNGSKSAGRAGEVPFASGIPAQGNQGRLFLHLLSDLQREGRLMDFICGDLTAHDDARIGAAVRGIQENCQRVIRQTLAPAAIVETEEGGRFTVRADTDPALVKVYGKVSGPPPFEGIVRHRGWRAARLELPTLAGKGDERLIAPAEIEIP